MNPYDEDMAAGEYVLGILSEEQRHRFEERLENEPALRRQVARWEALLSRLERGQAQAPPVDVWSRLEGVLERDASGSSFRTVRSEDGDWAVIRPGLERKLLSRDPTTGTVSYLIRLKAGAVIAEHQHARAEECLVLEGDVAIGELHLRAGDYHLAGEGTVHPVLRSRGGAVMFVRGDPR